MRKIIAALDQGTTSSRAILFDESLSPIGTAQKELTQYYPAPGWVEHDPMEIYAGQYSALTEVLAQNGLTGADLAAVGIANQRETTVVWEKETGKPVCGAVVWQCRRTAPICDAILRDSALTERIRRSTGLLPDAYFSATKLRWILDNVPDAQARAERGELLFGTVDSWLIYKLTGGAVHATDRTNASRTMLYNIERLCWDADICRALNIPMNMLPRVLPSGACFGMADIGGAQVPITGVAGDQQAALFGQNCFAEGDAKNTYGTGCFLLMNTGGRMCLSQSGLLTTLAATRGADIQYALEGSVFVGGAVVQWLRDEMELISDAADSEYFARKVPDSAGVYIVPAFTGLGAPHWDMRARGAVFGLTRGAGRCHLIRAGLESIAYQTGDVLHAMEKDTGARLSSLRVDGGASANGFLMQFQSDILGREIVRPQCRETTALGAAALAGLEAGVWQSTDEIARRSAVDCRFTPHMGEEERQKLLAGWQKAVARAGNWAGE